MYSCSVDIHGVFTPVEVPKPVELSGETLLLALLHRALAVCLTHLALARALQFLEMKLVDQILQLAWVPHRLRLSNSHVVHVHIPHTPGVSRVIQVDFEPLLLIQVEQVCIPTLGQAALVDTRQGSVACNGRRRIVLIATCKHLVWSIRIGRNMPI
jgi:hypothetical protein